MLGRTSVSMMVLLVAASLIGISSIHQYVEGQTPRVTKLPQQLDAVGTLGSVRVIDSPAGKSCSTALTITQTISPAGGLPPGTRIELVAPNEHWCTLFVLSKIVNKLGIGFVAQNIKATSLPPAIRTALLISPNDPVYRITDLDI
ncbi:MAG TPA: hypothetical protein VKA95_10380 [Nitrososphaeraceae archaeon]|nr:hypothetical protein [Nitrososphaeraceae archaeon]